MTQITKNHWIELIIRFTLFILTISSYIVSETTGNFKFQVITYITIWVFFMYKMIRRLIPEKIAPAGNQKLFKKNFLQTEIKSIKKDNKTTFKVAIFWLIPNIILWTLYFSNIFDSGIMMIIAMFYSVCDLICILYFCPFQKWIMKNRCCNTCRIYNWDYIMMFTPLMVIPTLYNYTLVGLSVLVFLIWEISYNKNPEKFHDETNDFIKCKNCKELMCKNKLRKV